MSEPGSLIRALSGRQAARNFHTFVINELGAGIVTGAFPVDVPLPVEAEIMERYDVSRTVLREAMKTLEAKGLVEARAKVGTKVLPRNRWNLFDRQVLTWMFEAGPDAGFVRALLPVRQNMTLQAARAAAELRTSDHMRMLGYWLNQRQACAGMPENCALAEFELQRILHEASQNPMLRAATALPEFAIAASVQARMKAGVTDFASATQPHFAELVGSMEKGDAVGVAGPLAAIFQAEAESCAPAP
jgi:DNA-binding FadR family transcriptional regulator